MFGALIENDYGNVLIDSETHNYHFAGKLSKTAHWRGPSVLRESGDVSNAYWTSPNGLAASQIRGNIFQYKYYTSDSSKPPLCFVKPVATGGSSPYFAIINTFYVASGYWEFWVLQSGTAYTAGPTIYLFVTADVMPVSSSDTYGFQTRDSAGNITFDSRYKPLRVTGAGQYQTPIVAVSGSKGSGTTPTLAPNINTQISTGNSVSLGDVIVHCPTFSTGCCEYELERETTYTHYNYFNMPTSTYAWGRYDFWWSFYRSGIQLDTTATMRIGYITFMSGHVWEHAYASGGFSWGALLGGLLLGGLTGGVGFGLLLGALAVSITLNNSTISGAYLPYENTTRNANESASYIISKASYYD